jgi:hypothetical protein
MTNEKPTASRLLHELIASNKEDFVPIEWLSSLMAMFYTICVKAGMSIEEASDLLKLLSERAKTELPHDGRLQSLIKKIQR